MPERRNSAAWRIAFAYAVVFSLAVLVLGLTAYHAADAEFRRQQDVGLAAEAQGLVQGFDVDGPQQVRRDIARREAGHGGDIYVYGVFDPLGRRTAGSLRVGPLAPGWHNVDLAPPGRGRDAGRALSTRLGDGETLLVALDTDALERVDRTILGLLAAGFLAVAVIGVAGALALGHFLRSKLERIGDTAAAIAAGELARRVPVGARDDEFDRLGRAINAMLDRIAGLMENLRQVSTDLAHDLRTPLSRVRGSLEAALDQDDPDRLRAGAERALGHSDDLLSLFSAVLRIAEVERGEVHTGSAQVDLTEIAADVVESYAPAVADGGRSLALTANGPVVVSADRALLAQALANLLDNAQLHTPAGTRIVVATTVADGAALISVIDDGPGVPMADRERIADRFVRLERSRSSPGHGLGLNMVAAIASAHGGTLRIDDAEPGLRVTMVLRQDTPSAG